MLKEKKLYTLKELIGKKNLIITAGIGDALSARIANDVKGIDALLSSGFAISAQLLGLPDIEMYTRTENVETVRRMTYVSNKPLIADVDTGYGNAINVIKTVHEFEQAGAEAMIFEDQISPKRCPICVDETNNILPVEEAAGKIRAAAENKLNPDTLIIARTDATNLDESIRRAKIYREAGADLVQPISKAFRNKEEVKQFVDAVDCDVSLVIVGWLEELSMEEIQWIGPKIAHFALVSVTASHKAVEDAFHEIGSKGTTKEMKTPRTPHGKLVKKLGMERVNTLEDKYLPNEEVLIK
ncbi:isocitrate lyase/PEP mutase family protein [Planococcus halocryophilus]|uniref:isocitrate lyase/PEP mutase family protein n=1 Tax=Planococcus halocryophilus TaxID=1215089 RepID=UPI001F111C62|nr:isocitrate lyase/PEP mutase family protein [Planococcus halocryophilus]MCH4827556.1 isocitrate lyase/PEP mutase family protein [Planococcus halocryophilus]